MRMRLRRLNILTMTLRRRRADCGSYFRAGDVLIAEID